MSEPMLHPTMASTRTPESSSAFQTPTCAVPFIPPPPSTSTVRGRCAWGRNGVSAVAFTAYHGGGGEPAGRGATPHGSCGPAAPFARASSQFW